MMRVLLALFAVVFSASGARAADATFRDWWAACDTQRTCWAFGFAPQDREGSAFLRIERAGAGAAEPVVLLAVHHEGAAGRAPLRVRVLFPDAPELRLDLPTRASDDSPHRIAEVRETAAARSLIAALRRGSELRVRVGGGEETSVSLDGATAALLWLDDQQKRVGTTTALVRPGSRPASAVPAPPARPVVRGAKAFPQGHLPSTWPRFVAAQPEVRDCLGDIFSDEAKEPLIARLDARTVLYGVPCSLGAYNLTSEFFLGDVTGAGWTRAEFHNAGVRQSADFGLVNAAFEPSTMSLSAFSKGRGLGDCGEATQWVWDGRRFVLAKMSMMGHCRGVPPEVWPTVYSAEVRR